MAWGRQYTSMQYCALGRVGRAVFITSAGAFVEPVLHARGWAMSSGAHTSLDLHEQPKSDPQDGHVPRRVCHQPGWDP